LIFRNLPSTLNAFKIIAITHKNAPLELIGLLHLDESHQHDYLTAVKLKMELNELMFLSTCNRVEFVIKAEREINALFLQELFSIINSRITTEQINALIEAVVVYEHEDALTHLFEVSSSLDSLVVGEREIITQVRDTPFVWPSNKLLKQLSKYIRIQILPKTLYLLCLWLTDN